MSSYAIIDGNSIGYAAAATRKLTANGLEVQAVFQSLKMLKSLKSSQRDYENFVWLWDGSAKFRLNMYPEYKGKRDDNKEMAEMREKYKLVRPIIEEGLKHLGITQVFAADYEADDLAGFFVRRLSKEQGRKILLVTGDQDWQQFVTSLVTWHDPRKQPGKYCKKSTFNEVTGVSDAPQFLELKSLQGDSSDNISGVGGLGPVAAIAIINNFGGVKNLIQHYVDNGAFTSETLPDDLKRFKKKLNTFCSSNIKLFTRNYRLMNLLTDERDEAMKQSMKITKGKKDLRAFKDFCHEHKFISIIREIDRWDELF